MTTLCTNLPAICHRTFPVHPPNYRARRANDARRPLGRNGVGRHERPTDSAHKSDTERSFHLRQQQTKNFIHMGVREWVECVLRSEEKTLFGVAVPEEWFCYPLERR
ncbi:hypothetical protein TNCV_1479081 [Trichonephila clavipes]|nr:hypothetical protein TNCV_1479081 [Trichonephila clavipes]